MTDWWRTFFHGVALDLWRLAVSPERNRADADRIETLLALPSGAKLLDAPSGNGRIALELARRGYSLTGVDIAPESVQEGTQAAQTEGLSAEFQVGNICELPWTERFDGAFSTGNSFGYFADADNEAYLRSVARALRPGGRFVLESPMVAESILHRVHPQDWYLIGDIYFLSEHRYDAVNGRLDTDYTFIRQGVVEKRAVTYRVYTCRQIREIIAEVGLEVVSTSSDLEGTPYTLGAEQMLLIARKT